MKKLLVFGICSIMLLVGVSGAGATTVNLYSRGASGEINGGIFYEFTEADQTTVSSGTGVIDPFLTIQKNTLEEGFNSDALPLVLDTTRPQWNHSIQISDLVMSPIPGYSGYYEFLVDINEPDGSKSRITQHELQVFLVTGNGAIDSLSALMASGTMIWDMDAGEDSLVNYDYGLWNGSGQNIDAAFLLPTTLFAGYSPDTYVYLYTQFGRLDASGYKSEDGFEEFCLRETPVPEPATMLLLGFGLIGLVGFGRKKFRR